MLAGLNLFLANVSILYPLETTEKQICFQDEVGKLVIKAGLTKNYLLRCIRAAYY